MQSNKIEERERERANMEREGGKERWGDRVLLRNNMRTTEEIDERMGREMGS